MKKIWVYLLGVLTGIVFTFLVLFVISLAINSKSGMTFFEQTGKKMNETSFEVFQALDNGTALARGKEDGLYLGLTVLIYNEEGSPYYDDQVINATGDKCFRQVGIYKYTANSGVVKTVPIVMLMDK